MADLVNYEMQVRVGGPGTKTESITPTAGTLAILVKAGLGLVCHDPSQEALITEVPATESVVDITPMLSLCKVTRSLDDPDAYAERTNEVWSVFGGGLRRTPEEVLAGLYWQRDRTAPLFGSDFNLPALDAIDLSGLPLICTRFRSNYYSIFEYQEGFAPAYFDAVYQGTWNLSVLDAVWDALHVDDGGPIHQLENWWHHAVSTLAIPVLEAALS